MSNAPSPTCDDLAELWSLREDVHELRAGLHAVRRLCRAHFNSPDAPYARERIRDINKVAKDALDAFAFRERVEEPVPGR